MDHLQQLLGPRGAPATPRRDDAVPDDGDWATRLVVAESYQPEQASTWDTAPTPTAPRVTLAVSTDLKQWNYRYMFEKKGERSLELDTRLSDMGDVLRQAFGLTTDWDDPSIPNQASIYTVGRICARVDPGDTDADAPASTRLTPTNLMLETSRMVGNGQRVPLVLDAKCVVRYAWADETAPTSSVVGLFPGMIVGLRGRNGSGHRFVAEELLMELLAHQNGETKLNGGPLRLVAASGPFTAPTDLAYRPWHALCSHLEATRPDVAVLHPKLASGDVDEMPSALFQRHISQRLARLLERSPSTVVILVPSTEDIFYPHCAFPQPFFDKSDPALGLPKRVRCLPNPCVFYVNELAIGVSTADVLGDLRREETVQRVQPAPRADGQPATPQAKNADPMVRLARHVLGQRSFYPLFPPSSASRLSLDLTHSYLCALDQVTPDLMLLPSATTKPFVRVIDSTLVANPGSLAPSSAESPPSAFVRLQVAPLPRAALYGGEDDADMLRTHALHERARLDIVHTPSVG